MIKKLLSLSAIVVNGFVACSQDMIITPQVLSSGGEYIEAADFNVSQTIGEMTAVVTLSSSSLMLTQGFQQGDIKFSVGISEAGGFKGELDLFPNPATTYTRLQYTFPQSGKLEMVIYNTLGQQISERFSASYSEGEQDFLLHTENIAAGVYYVQAVFTAESGRSYPFSKKLEIIR